MPRLRLGVVVLLPEPAATEIDGLRRAFADPARERVPPHVTLVPPVNVRVDDLGEVLAGLRAAAGATEPFALALGPAGTFWPATPVLKLDVAGEGLVELVALRDRVFRGPLERTLTWPFVPHVTLHDGADPERIPGLVDAIGWTGTVAVTRVHLLQEGEGRRWAVVADVPLGTERIVGRGGLAVELTTSEHLDPDAATLPGIGRGFACSARRFGAVVGAATGRVTVDAVRLDHLEVAEGERGLGIGSRLLDAVAALAAAGDLPIVATAADGMAARFLRRHGYVADETGLVLRRWS